MYHLRSKTFVCVEIYEKEKSGAAEEPARKVRGRGAVRADGISDFNPDSNLRISRSTDA